MTVRWLRGKISCKRMYYICQNIHNDRELIQSLHFANFKRNVDSEIKTIKVKVMKGDAPYFYEKRKSLLLIYVFVISFIVYEKLETIILRNSQQW